MIRHVLLGIFTLLSFINVLNAQLGCTIPSACNYNPLATVHGSCLWTFDCDGNCGGIMISDDCENCFHPNGASPPCSPGCTDPEADYYNSEANYDDGSCTYDLGCTDPEACNFNTTATIDNDSCRYFIDCAGVCGGTSVDDECGHCYDLVVQTGILQFDFTGDVQTWIVPEGVTEIEVQLFGAQGNTGLGINPGTGGLGSEVSGMLAVTAGDTLYIYVGGQNGFNGGGLAGNNNTGNGGGATDIRSGGNSTDHRVAVAGGGGGGGTNGCVIPFKGGDGGNGGGFPGHNGENWQDDLGGGFGGQLGIGGEPGLGCNLSLGTAGSGTGTGGNGTTSGCLQLIPGGGGGGGGYQVGGGGGGGSSRPYTGLCKGSSKGGGGGGAGGSNNTANLSVLYTETASRTGDGMVIISWDGVPSCVTGCTDPLACNYIENVDIPDDSCLYMEGCNDPDACNFVDTSICNDGSCTYPACMSIEACNYDPTAECDNGTCIYELDCAGNCGGTFIEDDCLNCYDSLWQSGEVLFQFSGSIENWIVPQGITQITIEARGAQGGSCSTHQGGLGAQIIGQVNVTPGESLKILVGGQGISVCDAAGGGGGSFVSTQDNIPLVVAGGGSGAASLTDGNPGLTTIAGGHGDSCGSNGGTDGNGGGHSASCGNGSGGGAGFFTDGGSASNWGYQRGFAFVNGGAGGLSLSGGAHGGFGGGAGAHVNNSGGGAGGGYSGGGAPLYGAGYSGGGGGSFAAQGMILANGGFNAGNGLIIISFSPIPICISGCSDPEACNFNEEAGSDDGSCFYPDGCTDPEACNYQEAAVCDDGSCTFPGCTSIEACNFEPGAECDNDSCIFEIDCVGNCGGPYIEDACGNCIDTTATHNAITFEFTGDVQTYTAPYDGHYTLEVFGAQGGDITTVSPMAGGFGGYASGSIVLSVGETVYVYVGGKGANRIGGNSLANCSIAEGGWNGGGASRNSGNGAPGGGASDIRIGGQSLSDRIIVAGGGGGGAWNFAKGGAGGGLQGENGTKANQTDTGAFGGTQNAGGATGLSSGACGISAGEFGQGGSASGNHPGGGGGGGGWYGGGGGGFADGGGGGSSYIGSLVNTTLETGIREGNGQVIITYIIPECVFGCTDQSACNYNENADIEDGSCILPDGCIDPEACNYDVGALCNDGTCSYPGCTDFEACNYNPSAACNNDLCIYEFDCAGNCGGSFVQDACGNCFDAFAPVGEVHFTFSGSIENWTVPEGVHSLYIEARGAQGGACSDRTGGLGARVSSQISVTPGQTLKILVGQQGVSVCNAAGGGGGSFVSTENNVPLVVAGGGSGATMNIDGNPGLITSAGGHGDNCGSNGGTDGNGGGDAGGCGGGAGGGGGYYTDGGSSSSWGSQRGFAFINGGAGGSSSYGGAFGGFGGGAGTHAENTGGGAGGGYSGGGAPSIGNPFSGGGGGSYAAEVMTLADSGFNSGNGTVIISFNEIPECNSGCLDYDACNFDVFAEIDDDSCIYSDGCIDPAACNYNASSQCDDGSCVYFGCTDVSACNFDPEAGCDDGLCFYFFDCAGVCGGTSEENECGDCYDPNTLQTIQFDFTEAEQTWVVPNGVTQIEVGLFGAQGNNGTGTEPGLGGLGAVVSGMLAVTPGETIYIYVGGQNGYNGGGAAGNGNDGNGGGATDIRSGGNTIDHRVAIAGGGGGGGATACLTYSFKGGDGGNGGAFPGQNGENWQENLGGGFGGQLGVGGAFGIGCSSTLGSAGTDLGTGGNGTIFGCTQYIPSGGGGGGGYHVGGGGGGGSSGLNHWSCNQSWKGGGGGGGGGSNLTSNLIELLVEDATRIGNGTAIIHWYAMPSCTQACTDSNACNYDENAVIDDGSCLYPDGCTDSEACNYNEDTVCDDGSCTYSGCTSVEACNYDPTAGCDDGSCLELDCIGNCGGVFVEDACGNCFDPTALIIEPGMQQFNFTGDVQTFIVPDGVIEITVEAFGARGGSTGNAPGGLGGSAYATIPTEPNESLSIYVGGHGLSSSATFATGGFNGGGGIYHSSGNASGGTGGGASDVRRGPDLQDRLIVAGGGGGHGWVAQSLNGGHGGDMIGFDGLEVDPQNMWRGRGGTQDSGGGASSWMFVTPGMFGVGGSGDGGGIDSGGGGGGGGGWYGGGGGRNSGGGGGSSYVSAPGNTNSGTLGGVNNGHGYVIISWDGYVIPGCNAGCTNPEACNFEPHAEIDDNSCILPDGCNDPEACNFSDTALCNNNSCIYPGCTSVDACNYDPLAGCNDDSCIFIVDCAGTCGGNFIINECGSCFDPTLEAETVMFNYTGSLQYFTVPSNISQIYVEAYGASGGAWLGQTGGLGAQVSGFLPVQPGQQLKLLVGGAGGNGQKIAYRTAGGGGGTFVTTINDQPLFIAGGGGGVVESPTSLGRHASVSETGNDGFSPNNSTHFGSGGSAGNGASNSDSGEACGGNGGGLLTDGETGLCEGFYQAAGRSFVNGALGGSGACAGLNAGGYGGGGAGGCHGGGGGGGYSGGGGSFGAYGNGGGGGSFNIASDGINIAQANSGHGYIVLTLLSDPPCIFGCTDPLASNYNPFANSDDGSCLISACTDESATNYNVNASTDDGSCLFHGCTYNLALNYNPNANIDDGSCTFGNPILGCMSSDALNYDPDANIDDDSCQFPEIVLGCVDQNAANFNPNATTDNGSCLFYGCTYSFAANFDPNANAEDGSCVVTALIEGCTNAAAFNYNENAQVDDGSCVYVQFISGCTYIDAPNYNPLADVDDGSCDLECETTVIYGCTDSQAINYMPSAEEDDGSCLHDTNIYGCTYSNGFNHDPFATYDDGSCIFENDALLCPADLNFDGVINAVDLSIFLSAFGSFCN